MSKPLAEKTPQELAVEKLLAKEVVINVGDKEHKFQSIAQLYLDGDDEASSSFESVTRFRKIKHSLIELCEKNPIDTANFLLSAERIFQERALVKVQFENVKREEFRIREKELSPQKLDLTEFVNHIPADKERQLANNWFGHDPRQIQSASIVRPRIEGATESEMLAILEGRTRHPFIQHPGKFYRNAVFDTEILARDNLRVNDAKLKKFLTKGVATLDQKEEGVLRRHNPTNHKLSNVAQAIGYGALEVSKIAGRGLISKTEASESANYKEYNKQRNKALYEMLWKSCPGENRTSYFQLLKARNAALLNSGNPEDVLMAEEMNRELDEMLKTSEAEDKKRFEDLQKKIEQHAKDTLEGYVSGGKRVEGLQDHINKQDEAHKWLVMCAFIAMGPFTGVLIAPALGSVIGPVLAGSGSFAHNLSLLAANPIFGPFADLVRECRIPDAISWILHNVPIIEQLSDIMNFATRNPIAEGLFAEALPLVSSPIVSLALAGLAVTAGASQQYLLHTDKQDFLDSRKKSLESETGSFVKESERMRAVRIDEVALRNLNATKRANRITKLTETIFDSAKTGEDLIRDGEINGLKFLDHKAKDKLLELKSKSDLSQREVEKFVQSLGKDTLDKIDGVRKFDQDFILQWGKDREVKTFSSDPKQQCKDIEAEFLRRRRADLKDLPYSILPATTVENPAAAHISRSKDTLDLPDEKEVKNSKPKSRDTSDLRHRPRCHHQHVRC